MFIDILSQHHTQYSTTVVEVAAQIKWLHRRDRKC